MSSTSDLAQNLLLREQHTFKEVKVMKTTHTTSAIAWKGKETSEMHRETARVTFIDTLLMLPAGIIGLIIGTFPLSLPILYLIALWMLG